MKDSLEITKEAVVGMVPVMEAEGLEELAALAKANNCRTMLEIGTAVARTAVYMAEQGLNVTTIERDPDIPAFWSVSSTWATRSISRPASRHSRARKRSGITRPSG